MKQLLLAASCIWLLASANCLAQLQVLLDQVNQLELQGQFREAAKALTHALSNPALSAAERHRLELELDRLERIKKDYLYTKEALFAELQKSVKGLTAGEYERWLAEGRFDARDIDGRRYFMNSSLSNLFFRHPELNPRQRPLKDTRKLDQARWKTCQQIQQAALAQKTPYVLPKRFRITLTVTARPNAVPAGEMVRAWLPIPRQYPFQTDFALISASPRVQYLDHEQSPIRCAYLEQPARKDKVTEFEIKYDYTVHGVWFDINPDAVRACDANDPALQPFTREAPHVVFTPEMRALSQQIAGTETNPCLKARLFYNWIAEHIQYSYAIEYSTIRNLSDYCRTRGYGDCGQQAFLFITLCRLNGIPARWQSGWNTFPGVLNIHDWSEVFIAPYGWIPVDPYMGGYAMRYATTLNPEQKRALRDFYFGGLDQYRLIANSNHNQILTPPKRFQRSDPVDFQRGELESGHHNLYFDQYAYQLRLKERKLPRGKE